MLWFPKEAQEGAQSLDKAWGHHEIATQVLEEVLKVSHYHEAEEAVQSTQPKDVHCALHGGCVQIKAMSFLTFEYFLT